MIISKKKTVILNIFMGDHPPIQFLRKMDKFDHIFMRPPKIMYEHEI